MWPIRNITEFHRPKSVKEAVKLLSDQEDKAKLICGGTDLLPQRQGGRTGIAGNHLVDISGLGLNYIRKTKDAILIGAATDINAIAGHPVFLLAPYNALSEAALAHSTLTLRNRATIGGNLCNASPHADLSLPLLVLDAELVIEGHGGQKTLALKDFFCGPHCTVLDASEILTEIRIPLMTEKSGTHFIKLTRQHTAIDMAVVNAATCLSIKNGICTSAGIALGSAGPMPFRAKKAEALLLNHAPDEALFQKAALVAADEAAPIDDIRATAAYRKKMILVLVKESLEKSLERSLS